MSQNDINTAVESIMKDASIAQSEKEKIMMTLDPKLQFINYLTSSITSLTTKNKLHEEIEKSLGQELADGLLSTGAKLKLFEILTKKETDIGNYVLTVLAKAIETKNAKSGENPNSGDGKVSSGSNVSQEDYVKAKQMMEIFDKISKSEFTPDEFFQKKK